MPETERIPLVWSALWRPAGALIGSLADRAWVEVGPDLVTACFGPLGHAEVPRAAIRAAALRPWHWWFGYGIRWYGPRAVGFVGRSHGVVEISIDPPVLVKAVLSRIVSRLALSPQDPERLLGLLGVPPPAT
jgi:hypothetical protein